MSLTKISTDERKGWVIWDVRGFGNRDGKPKSGKLRECRGKRLSGQHLNARPEYRPEIFDPQRRGALLFGAGRSGQRPCKPQRAAGAPPAEVSADEAPAEERAHRHSAGVLGHERPIRAYPNRGWRGFAALAGPGPSPQGRPRASAPRCSVRYIGPRAIRRSPGPADGDGATTVATAARSRVAPRPAKSGEPRDTGPHGDGRNVGATATAAQQGGISCPAEAK